MQFTYLNENRNREIAGFKVVGDWNECYLSIPVMLKYNLQLTREIGVFVKAGPTIDEGLLQGRSTVRRSVMARTWPMSGVITAPSQRVTACLKP